MTIEEALVVLKTTYITKENIGIIKEKLRMTSNRRLEILNDPAVNLLEEFNYFFTCPELVSGLNTATQLLVKFNFNLIHFLFSDFI